MSKNVPSKRTNNQSLFLGDLGPKEIAKSFLAGGVAGCCAKTSTAPLDRTKILLQVHRDNYAHLSVTQAVKYIYKSEGVPGLFRGNGVMMIRIFPYAATQFTSYECYKRAFSARFGPQSKFGRFCAGSFAGVTAVVLTYPLDFLRSRMAYQTSEEMLYKGFVDAFTKVYKNEGGFRAFYRGITPSLIGMVPYAGMAFYTFETAKNYCLHSGSHFLVKRNPDNEGELILRIPANLVVGGLAGAFSQTFSYPMDVARRRMQLAKILPHGNQYTNFVSTLIFVYKQHGITRGLFRGLSINYIRMIPQISISFTVYETMKRLLKLKTGIPIKTG